MGLGQQPDQQHGQSLAGHARQYAVEPEPRLAASQVQPGGEQTGDDAGDETRDGGVTIHVDEVAVQPRDDSGRNADPGAEQYAARDDGDDPHVDEGPLHRNAGVGAEHREQTEDGRDQHQLGRGVIPLLEQALEGAGAGQEEQGHQHQGRPFKHRQQHHLIFEHGPSGLGPRRAHYRVYGVMGCRPRARGKEITAGWAAPERATVYLRRPVKGAAALPAGREKASRLEDVRTRGWQAGPQSP
ncbi:hypothetical protein D3C79_716110 [compost metagenome]